MPDHKPYNYFINVSSEEGNDKTVTCRFVNRTENLNLGFGYVPENLLINVTIWLILLFLFAIFRKRAWNYGRIALVTQKIETKWTQLFYTEVETPTEGGLLSHQDSVDSIDMAVHVDHGFCSWLTAIFKIKDEHFIKKCGPDSVQYLSFQRYIIVYLGIICIVCLTVVLPVNFQGTLEGDTTSFGHTTMSNLDPKSPLLWIHVILSFLFLPLGVFLMRHFSVNLKYEDQDNNSVSRTLMITHVPKNRCSRNIIMRHFSEAYPEAAIQDIQFAYNISHLISLDRKRDAAYENRLFCEDYLKERGQRLQMRPCICSWIICKCCKCCTCRTCQEVDALDYYAEKENKFSKQVDEEKSEALKNPLGIIFVTFQSEDISRRIYKDHQTSCKCGNNPPSSSLNRELEPLAWGVYNAPPPDDIYWENLSSDTDYWYIRAALINFGLFLVLFFLTTPAIFANGLALFHFQDKLQTMHPMFSEFTPTLMILCVAVMLPVIVSFSDQFLYHWTRSSENHSKMRKTFIFLLFMIIILPSLGLTSAKAFVEWAVKPANDTAYRWKCVFLPDNGAFFVNYIITSAFIGTAFELIRLPELFLYAIKIMCTRSKAERARVRREVMWEFSFGTQYAWMLLNVAVTIIYSLPCPIITPFGVVYICLKHAVDRYNIYFAYGPSKINKRVHVTAINFVVSTIILLQVVILFFVFVRSGGARDLSQVGMVFWFAVVGCCISLLLYVGQIFFKVFKGVGAISYKETDRRDRARTVEDRTVYTTPHVRFMPTVLYHSDEISGASSTQTRRGYGTSSAESGSVLKRSPHRVPAQTDLQQEPT